MHLLIVWAAVFLTWGLGLHPTWRDYGRTVAITATWAVRCSASTWSWVPTTASSTASRQPRSSTCWGPWPLYVVVEIALVSAVWALMTWPWERNPPPGAVPASCRE